VDLTQVNNLRQSNAIPFKILTWLEELKPVAAHDEFGSMYIGCVLAEDSYGKYSAIVGTTYRLLETPLDAFPNGTPYKILKIDQVMPTTVH